MRCWLLFVTGWLIMAPQIQAAELPLIVGHRGCSHDAPENTLAAFKLAWEQGADAIEGDFHLTRDGEIACIHDKDTERVSGKKRKLIVAESTLAELQQVDVGSWKHKRYAGERVPTLRDVLATVPAGKTIYIEIKCGPEILPALKLQLTASSLTSEQIIIISFDDKVIAESKRQLPGYKAQWITSFKPDEKTGVWTPSLESVLQTLRETRADGLDCKGVLEVVTPTFVQALRSHGHEFHTWTINEPEQAARLCELGVQSLTTDRPGFLRAELEKRRQESRP